MILFENVTKNFGQVKALEEVTFEIHPGEVFGYLGPNGAGKTTTLKILAGLIGVYDGSVKVDGHDVSTEGTLAKSATGYVPQDAGFQEWRTVDHALKTFSRLSRIDRSIEGSRIDGVLELLGISEHRRRKITHLSGGTVQKLRIAQALLHDPDIMVLDEPLSGLDPASRFDLKEIIKNLRNQGKTVLLSSHILNDVEGIADRIGIINAGRLVKVGTPEGLREEYNVGLAVDVETSDGSKCAALLENVGTYRIEVLDDNRCRIFFDSGADYDREVASLLRRILAEDLAVRSVVRVQPSLEDVYLSLTGGGVHGN